MDLMLFCWTPEELIEEGDEEKGLDLYLTLHSTFQSGLQHHSLLLPTTDTS